MHREPEAETRDRVRPDAIVGWPEDHEHDIWDLRGEVRLLGFGIVLLPKGGGSPLFIGSDTLEYEITKSSLGLQHTPGGHNGHFRASSRNILTGFPDTSGSVAICRPYPPPRMGGDPCVRRSGEAPPLASCAPLPRGGGSHGRVAGRALAASRVPPRRLSPALWGRRGRSVA